MQYHFSGFTYDADRVQLRRGDTCIEAQPKVMAFLHVLLAEEGRALSKSELLDRLWPGVTVDEGSLQRVVSLARRALDGCGDEVIATVRGVGYRLDAPVEIDASASTSAVPSPAVEQFEQFEQEIGFATTDDGVSIAYAVVGEGPPLVRSLGWFTNLESEWRWPAGRSFWERLARNHTLIRYDGRGIGLSDPCDEFSADTRLRDLEAVVDAVGVDSFDLLGMSEGCANAVRFAARYPDRVNRMALYGPPNSIVTPSDRAERERWKTLLQMVRQGWSDPSPVYRQFFSTLFLGAGADREMIAYFNEMQQTSADAETVARYLSSLPQCAVDEIAQEVKAPTLVLHRREDVLCPFAAGRQLAKMVPGARFVPLEGENHWLVVQDPGSEAFVDALEQFLSRDPDASI